MLNIYRSRESIDKESFIYNHILQQREKGESNNSEAGPNHTLGASLTHRTLVIVPDQYTLAAERQAMDRMKTEVLFDVEITSISRLGSRLLEETGSNTKTVINQYGRHMLISRVLRELRDELDIFKNYDTKETFIKAINDFISASKQHEVTPGSLMMLANAMSHKGTPIGHTDEEPNLETIKEETIKGETNREGNELFIRKLRDLSRIYAKYQEHLKGKYTDNEDLIDLYIEAISKSKIIKNSTIWIYGFDSYTPKNRAFILALAAQAKEVNLHLIYDDNCRDEDLFTLSAKMTEAFQSAAKYISIQVNIIDIEPKNGNDEGRSDSLLEVLERELFAVGRKKYRFQDTTEESKKRSIEIVRCPNMYGEADAAASYILKLLREKNYRFSDMVLICNDLEMRGAIIGRVFNEYGMDVFDDKKRDALGSPVAVFVLSLLDTLAYRFRSEDILRLLKTGLTEIPEPEIDELENYVIKYRIRGNMWRSPFVRGSHEARYSNNNSENDNANTLLHEIELTRQKVMTLINEAEEVFDNAAAFGEFARGYLEFLTNPSGITNLPNRIEELVSRQEAYGLKEQAEATSQILDIISGLIEQIEEIMGEEPFDGVEFAKLLRSGLSELEVGVLPPTPDDILMGTMQRTRSGDCKAMLIIGANDNLIPRTAEEDVLFSPEELELLAADDQDLGLGSDIRLMEENLAIYRNLSKPTEHLWISYSATDQKGDELRPSDIVNVIHEVFPDLDETIEQGLDESVIKDSLGGKVNTLRRYTDARRKEKTAISPIWGVVEDWLSENDDEILRRVNRALSFDNLQKPLPGDLAAGLYAKYIDRDGEFVYRFSPTTLERYSRCPFSYYLDYGLRPEELRIDEVGPRDIGELYHTTIQRFTEILGGRDGDGWNQVTREESDGLVEKLAKEWAKEYRSKLFEKSGSETYRFNRAIKACQFIAWTLVEQARAGLIKESHFETVFAPEPSRSDNSYSSFRLPPIVKTIPGGKAYIQGKIDRIDILSDESVKIIDYKTGKESLDVEEIKAGYRLQLMLYLQAAQNKSSADKTVLQPAGVFYFLISEPELNLGEIKRNVSHEESEGELNTDPKKEIEEKLMNFYRMEGLMVDKESVVRGIAGDLYDEFGEPLSSAASKVVKLKRKKDGELDSNSKKHLLNEEDFGELQNTVDMIATQLCKDITSGKIDLTPKKSGNKTPCDYCNYKSICRFDTIFPGCRYEVVK